MAKRNTGVGSKQRPHPHKPKKRLEKKRAMLIAKLSKGRKHNRPVRSIGKIPSHHSTPSSPSQA